MARKKVFAVGDLCIDVLYSSKGRRVGEEHHLSSLDFSVGGNAANFAFLCARLGLHPKLYTIMGKDFGTPFLMHSLKSEKLDLYLAKSPLKNSYSLVWVNKRGERAIESIKNCLKDLTVEWVQKRLMKKVKPGDIVVFGGFFHLKNFRKGFGSLLKKLKGKGVTICFDTCFDTFGNWNVQPYLPFIDFLFTNETELKRISRGGSMHQRIVWLLGRGADTIVVKKGVRGASIFKGAKRLFSMPALKTKVVDTTGAGDAFNAGFVFGLVHGWSMQRCIFAGNVVAARKIRQHGLATPNKVELKRIVEKKFD